MPYDPETHKGRLRRLNKGAYQGHSWVHWTMGVKDRKTGWLNATHHHQFRELLLHSLVRQNLVCAIYCLMPDHAHFLIGGLLSSSDQKPAIKFLRKYWNLLLRNQGDFALQIQAYNHVLDAKESSRSSFKEIAGYVLENPARGRLVESFKDWPYLRSMAPGFPDLHPTDPDFWERFWKIYYSLLDPSPNV